MTQQTQKQLDTIVAEIVTKYRPKKIILFGSAARGEATEDSDIDLLIIKDGVDQVSPIDRHRDVARLYRHTVASDVLVYTPYEIRKRLYLGDPFIKAVFSEGKTLYDA
ncbi:nucleotidyltransferase domain-containing protein [Candidatus Gottesmanbacteria bacterium]|nr:nucleotidyltransferase domain-containing protein [Candidatus Gottesmanbacteria bacterium]